MVDPTTFRLREAASATVKPRIDEAKAIVYNVKVMGLSSRNKARYEADKLDKHDACKLLESATCYLNHDYSDTESGAPAPRRIEDEFGSFRNVYRGKDGYYAREFHYDPLHPYAPRFARRVKTSPRGIGFSIDADGLGRVDRNGVRVVEQLTKVRSVDLVVNPATTFSLFEQDMEPLTDPAAPATDTMTDDTGGDHKQQLVEAAQAVASELGAGSMDLATAKKKLMAILALIDDGATEPDGDEGTGDPEETPLTEQTLGKLLSEQQKTNRLLEQFVQTLGKPKTPPAGKPKSAPPEPVSLKEQTLTPEKAKSLAAECWADDDE